MTKQEFKAALKAHSLGTASKATVRAIGLSISQLQRLSSGRQKVGRPIELLLHMYDKHGIPRQLPGEEA